MVVKELWLLRVAVLFAALIVTRAVAFAEVDCNVAHTNGAERAACRAQLERAWRDVLADETEALRADAAKSRTGSLSSEVIDGEGTAMTRKNAALEKRKAISDKYALHVASPEEAFHSNHCERPEIICYDRNGELFSYGEQKSDALPAAVRVGDKVTVLVLTQQKVSDDEKLVTVSFLARKSQDRLLPDSLLASDKEAEELRILEAKAPLPPSYAALPPFASDPVPDDVVDFTIFFQRLPSGEEHRVDKTDVIPVDLGYSYYSVAFLAAATFKGDRHVLRDLGTTSDHAVDPGLALNIFPFGRQRGTIGYIRKCTWAHPRRCVANMIGFQIGTDLDFTKPTDKLFAGLVFEPVAGLAIVGGVALRKVAVVPPAGALPALEAMDGSSPSDSRYVTRGYVGVTITLDLLDTISSIGTKIKNVQLQ